MSRTIIATTTIDSLFVTAAKEVMKVVTGCFKEGRECTVALAGGSTPRGLYRLLTSEPYRSQIPWEYLRVFWGDERTVPPDHQESNFRMAEEALLSHVPVPLKQVFRIEGELPADEAAARYEAVLREQFRLLPGEVPRFDLILLGMGPDGHTASLFPGTSAVAESHKLVTAPWVEKFHTHRVTLTPPVLNAAKQVIFLVSGHDKSPALQAVLEGPFEPARYPAQVIKPTEGRLVWLINQDAADLLQPDTITSRVPEGREMMKMVKAPVAFIQALHKRPISCSTPNCSGPVAIEERTRATDRVKSFDMRCEQCDWHETITGDMQVDPPWDEGSLMEITEEHLLHLEPVCPYDQAPLDFHSLPNPRRRARYRISCFFCGRQEELDWPPEEAKR